MRCNPSLPCGDPAAIPSDCEAVELGVAFSNLSRIPEWGLSAQDEGIAGFFQKLYAMAARCLEPTCGRIVKLMGDAGLCVFCRHQHRPRSGYFACRGLSYSTTETL